MVSEHILPTRKSHHLKDLICDSSRFCSLFIGYPQQSAYYFEAPGAAEIARGLPVNIDPTPYLKRSLQELLNEEYVNGSSNNPLIGPEKKPVDLPRLKSASAPASGPRKHAASATATASKSPQSKLFKFESTDRRSPVNSESQASKTVNHELFRSSKTRNDGGETAWVPPGIMRYVPRQQRHNAKIK
jgi:hypothetical protein